MKDATVRFYVDADLGGLARVLASLRSDVTYPGDPGAVIKHRRRPACPVTTADTPDSTWIPEIAGRGWLVITKDAKIREHRAEVSAVRDNNCRMVVLRGEKPFGRWEQLEVTMVCWRRIEALLDTPGPFIYRASRTGGLRNIDLD